MGIMILSVGTPGHLPGFIPGDLFTFAPFWLSGCLYLQTRAPQCPQAAAHCGASHAAAHRCDAPLRARGRAPRDEPSTTCDLRPHCFCLSASAFIQQGNIQKKKKVKLHGGVKSTEFLKREMKK